MITTEILIPESLFRQLQQALDAHPTLSADELLSEALTRYLTHLLQSHSSV
jgi:hypothetical protein